MRMFGKVFLWVAFSVTCFFTGICIAFGNWQNALICFAFAVTYVPIFQLAQTWD